MPEQKECLELMRRLNKEEMEEYRIISKKCRKAAYQSMSYINVPTLSKKVILKLEDVGFQVSKPFKGLFWSKYHYEIRWADCDYMWWK